MDATDTGAIQEQVGKAADFFSDAGDYLRDALPLLLLALVVFVVGVFVSKLVSRMFARTLKRSKLDNAAAGFLVSVVRIVLYAVVLIMALSVLKVPMSSVITILGAAGLAVSLALQNCLANLCGGFILLFQAILIGRYG